MRSDLEEEVADARLKISADTISMSISELTNLYREGVLVIRPEFQRLFRWTIEQKSRLIESLLLGIPLPSIFVAQVEGGTWELVDGLQRVSTILELQGELVDTTGAEIPSTTLNGTKYLPSLEGMSWFTENSRNQLSDAQKLDLRLSRLDIRIIKRGSDESAKFDLFQRLNSYGSVATAQEIRSALIASINSDCLAWLTQLAAHPSFVECLALSARQVDEQTDLELVLRFLMLHNRKLTSRAGLSDFATKLDDWSVELANDFSGQSDQLGATFRDTFDEIGAGGGEDVFRKWEQSKGRFRGAFSNTSFEVIGLGTGYLVANSLPHRTDFTDAAKELWSRVADRFTTGLATQDRFAVTIPMGRNLMQPGEVAQPQ